jgi:uncharacterized protein DUF6788
MAKPRPNPRARRAQQRLTRQPSELGFALPGILIERHMRCGEAGCRCKDDPPILHGPYLQWTRKVGNKTVTRLLTPDQRDRDQTWFDNDAKLKQLASELEALSLEAANQAEGWDNI